MDMVHYVEHTSVAWGKVMPAKRGCFACPYGDLPAKDKGVLCGGQVAVGEALRLRRLRKILAQRSEGPKVRPASRRISHLNKVRKTIVAGIQQSLIRGLD